MMIRKTVVSAGAGGGVPAAIGLGAAAAAPGRRLARDPPVISSSTSAARQRATRGEPVDVTGTDTTAYGVDGTPIDATSRRCRQAPMLTDEGEVVAAAGGVGDRRAAVGANADAGVV